MSQPTPRPLPLPTPDNPFPSRPGPCQAPTTPAAWSEPAPATSTSAGAGHHPVTWPLGAGPAAGHNIITVPIKSCCGALLGDWCDCAAFAASAFDAFDAPIVLPPHCPGLVPLTDPALAVDRD